MNIRRRVTPALLAAFALIPALRDARAGEFYLKDGDRVVFYGDSITDQRLYTTYVETFAVTRFPDRTMTFVHSGWGGDRVSGGGGGPIDVRLKRDVFAYKPTVMTIMLGMNDASYQPFKQEIFDAYEKGYKHIVEEVKKNAPGIRLTLIQPSPFDDVTRPPTFEGGYNAVLARYGEFVKQLAKDEGVDAADLNTYVVGATKKAFEKKPETAFRLNEDRVHPGPGGQLLMAAALLKAWDAPAVVSEVEIDAASKKVAREENTRVEGLEAADGGLSWTQKDKALPFPLRLDDPLVALAVSSSDVVESLDRQPLKVTGLSGTDYVLKIDGKEVGTFSKGKLAEGINLAVLKSPVTEQALQVHQLTTRHNDVHFFRWRFFQVPMEHDDLPHLKASLESLDALEADLVARQREAARPLARKFELAEKK